MFGVIIGLKHYEKLAFMWKRGSEQNAQTFHTGGFQATLAQSDSFSTSRREENTTREDERHNEESLKEEK